MMMLLLSHTGSLDCTTKKVTVPESYNQKAFLLQSRLKYWLITPPLKNNTKDGKNNITSAMTVVNQV